ncbi:dTDP-4-amino-4,6-dideoxy-D-galactose acyltransferase [Providencia sp. JGM181]|uniref:dTDP-4-amino-4,6-dideoxy-D-galactose acyltransferase n=1 Tax=unclassified Providencia TaxID=2633465 RepID=UPI001BA5D6A2|nr:dTDP-4-amino-4,6-dideoxy-D-galactose acyltransferase [Providencia sp. JGM181]MBS0933745.1 dTDP-4-amino-4,6-dideoxy-D-galactose acyltransferase [Providencia sp. JGM172]MBS0998688.1 dTDP-4-amino-4,6-dideoxy-D-galactose acyltransferase [Providencia sp. JGM178]
MSVRANIDPLDWESDFFKRSTAKLDFAATDAQIILSYQLDKFDIVQAKVAASETAKIDELASMGFSFVEGEIDFALTIGTENAYLNTALSEADNVVVAQTGDIVSLRDTAASVFSNSRFRTPWYHEGDSGRFYALWIEKAVLGTFDHTCLLLRDNAGDILGFVSLRSLDANTARIGLLAATPSAAGRGIGRKLMSAAYQWCVQHQKRQLNVATQMSNVAALNLYSRSGAAIASTAYWLYRGQHDSI